METPWRIDGTGTVVTAAPERWLFPRGDWAAVEGYLAIELPAEYKELIGSGRALEFDEELIIASPFDRNPYCNLVQMHAEAAWGLAYLRHEWPDQYPIALFPEPGGMLCWGGDGGGAAYFYDTTDWTVFVSGRPLPEPGLRYDTGIRGYLAGLADGSIESESLGDWPGPEPTLRRRALRAGE